MSLIQSKTPEHFTTYRHQNLIKNKPKVSWHPYDYYKTNEGLGSTSQNIYPPRIKRSYNYCYIDIILYYYNIELLFNILICLAFTLKNGMFDAFKFYNLWPRMPLKVSSKVPNISNF